MTDYTILETDNLPDILKNKPRWVTCVSVALGMFVITASAVALGTFIGYTYCYLEHHTGFRTVTGNITQSLNYNVVNIPMSEEARYNRTINGALISSLLVSKILSLGHIIVENEPIHPVLKSRRDNHSSL